MSTPRRRALSRVFLILILGLVSAAIGLVFVWVLLDTSGLSARLAAALATAIPAIVAAGYACCVADERRLWAVIQLWLVVALYSSAAMGVLRVAGCRTGRGPGGCGTLVRAGLRGVPPTPA